MRPGQQLTLSIDHQTDFHFIHHFNPAIFIRADDRNFHRGRKPFLLVNVYKDFYFVSVPDERLAATMKIPVISADEYGWVEVVDKVEDMGVFVDVGLSKDALVATLSCWSTYIKTSTSSLSPISSVISLLCKRIVSSPSVKK